MTDAAPTPESEDDQVQFEKITLRIDIPGRGLVYQDLIMLEGTLDQFPTMFDVFYEQLTNGLAERIIATHPDFARKNS